MNFYTEEERINAIKEALKNRRVSDIHFASDNSCVAFEFSHPTADHGLPCTVRLTINIQAALDCLKNQWLRIRLN